MSNSLDLVLTRIGMDFKERISIGSRFYLEVDIGKQAEIMGCAEIKERYHDVCAIVPLKYPAKGMKVRVDGRSFVNYAQFESGIVVPNYVADDAGLSYKIFVPNDSMIRNYT
jgi:hypothetical protein